MSIFKIKRKLHPKFPDHIPPLTLHGEDRTTYIINYMIVHDTPVAIVHFNTKVFRKSKSYRWNGNWWQIMGDNHVQT